MIAETLKCYVSELNVLLRWMEEIYQINFDYHNWKSTLIYQQNK